MRKNYSLLKNIRYCFSKLSFYKKDIYYIYAFFYILFSVVTPLALAAYPGFAVGLLTSEKGVGTFLKGILFAGLVVVILSVLQTTFKELCTFKSFEYRIVFGVEFVSKTLSIPYQYTEGREGKKKVEKANAAFHWGNEYGCEAIVNDTTELILSIVGTILFSLVAMSLHPALALVLILCPIARVLYEKENRKWTTKHKEERNQMEIKLRYLNTQSIELKNGKDIRLYGIRSWFSGLFDELIGKRTKWEVSKAKRTFGANFVDRILSIIRDGICYGYLVYRMIHGMSIAEFTVYLGVIAGFGKWITDIFAAINRLLANNIIMNDAREFLEEKDDWEYGGNRPLLEGITHTITLENVTFSYPDSETPTIHNLNLTINVGESIALVGMNGAGKTTLIKLICGLYTPSEGRILLDDVDIKEFNRKELYTLFSVVFQDVFAFAFPVAENIACCREEEFDKDRLEKSIELAGLSARIKKLNYQEKTVLLKDLDEEGVMLSGGEMQKLMLARALYKQSSIVILDEPTAALDPIAEREMYEKYASLTQGRTSIFISHRLSSTRFCDRVIFLKEGMVVEDGSHGSLMNLNGEYAKMFEVQAHYYQEEVSADGNKE